MHLETLEILSLADDAGRFASRLGKSFRRFGFAMVRDHGIDPALVRDGWALTRAFFDLPVAEKQCYQLDGLAGARGYTPFRTEIAKGAAAHDLKEFWHVGRDLPANHPLAGIMPANIWPSRPEAFRETFTALFAEFDRVGSIILSHIAAHLALPADWFDTATADGNSVLRLLHYPPVEAGQDDAIRAGAHEDINLITLLLGAEEAGLELLTRDGRWLTISPPDGAIYR